MKKVLLVILSLAVIFSCKPEVKKSTVSFTSAIPIMKGEIASLLISSNYSGANPVEVEIMFGGTAIKGQDYKVSTEKFVLGGSAPVKELLITPLVYGSKKTVTVSIKAPKNFVIDKYPTSTFVLADKIGYVSFVEKSYLISGEGLIKLNLLDGKSNLLRAINDIPIMVEVDQTKSTAIEGTHFEIVGKNNLSIKQGKYEILIPIKILKSEAGKDKIVLKIVENPRLGIGQYLSTNISLVSDFLFAVNGKWQVSKIIPTASEYAQSWAFNNEAMVGYPEVVAGDSFEINVADSKFIPHFTSTLKNYFIGESIIKHIGKVETYIPRPKTVDQFSLSNVNRYFSATEMSTDKEGYIAIELDNSIANEPKLLLVLHDFISKSFAKDLEAYDMYNPKKPVANTGGVLLSVEFTKVK